MLKRMPAFVFKIDDLDLIETLKRDALYSAVMEISNLSQSQVDILAQLVKYKRNGELIEPFIPLPMGPANYIIYLKTEPSLHVKWISDLDILCLFGYLNFQWNRMSTGKAYWVSQFKVTADPTPHELADQIIPEALRPVVFMHASDHNDQDDQSALPLKEAFAALMPSADLDDALRAISEISWMTKQVNPNTRQILQKVDYTQRLAHSFMRTARTRNELEKQAALNTALGAWQLSIIRGLEAHTT